MDNDDKLNDGYDPRRCLLHGAVLKDINEKIDRLLHHIEGNGKPGLRIEVDRLNQFKALHSKVIWALTASIIGIVCEMVYKWVAASHTH